MADFTKEELIQLIQITKLIPELKVNREEYLNTLFSDCSREILNKIIKTSPIDEFFQIDNFMKKVKYTIKNETSNIMAFFKLIPKETIIGSININVIRYIAHLLVILQKLCYLFDMPYFSDNDDITGFEITIILIYLGTIFDDKRAINTLYNLYIECKNKRKKIKLTKIIDSNTIDYLYTLFAIKLKEAFLFLTTEHTLSKTAIHRKCVQSSSNKILDKFLLFKLPVVFL